MEKLHPLWVVGGYRGYRQIVTCTSVSVTILMPFRLVISHSSSMGI